MTAVAKHHIMSLRGGAVAALAAAITVLAVGGCSTEEAAISTQQGYIDLSVRVDASFRLPDNSMTSAAPTDVPPGDSLAVTLSDADGASHTWPTVAAFRRAAESYNTGTYTATVEGATGSGPHLSATTSFNIKADALTSVDITATPDVAMLRARRTDISDRFTLNSLTVYAPLQGFVDICGPESTLYVSPGNLHAYARINDNSCNRSALIAIPATVTVNAAHVTDIDISLDNDRANILVDGKENGSVTLADGIPDDKPEVTPAGFVPGEPIHILEGLTLKHPVTMTVASQAPLTHVNIVVESPIVRQAELDYNAVDLLNLSTADREFLKNGGFSFTVSDDRRTVVADFTHMLEELASRITTQSRFMLLAENADGSCNDPIELLVNTQVMELSLLSVGEAVAGVDLATVSIKAGSDVTEQSDFAILAADATGAYTVPLDILSMSHDENSSVTLTFRVPEGISDVPVSIQYLGLQRFTATVRRINPKFAITVDPFATTAIIQIAGLDPDIPDAGKVRETIVRYGAVTVNGSPASVWLRRPDMGAIIITGLSPEKNYRIGLTLVAGTTAATATAATEKAAQVPMGDFSDWQQEIEYSQLACGGKFSATPVPIVNRQNYKDISVNWPKKHWASLNAKTFSRNALRHNTWYMQPSAALVNRESGSYVKSVMLSSVGYDHSGESIADYIQAEGQSQPYSGTVPRVKSRAAGRLWLGSYRYRPETDEENIAQGVPFDCRPSALNGFFKYLPDLTDGEDYGRVEVELVHINGSQEIVIAQGEYNFRTQPDYAAFKCPIEYKTYNLKPTHLRIMFVSSHYAEGSGRNADTLVPVTADLPDACMRGSTLWVSQLSFSY